MLANCKAERLDDNWIVDVMRIIPVNFKSEHKAMLGDCKMILEPDGDRIAIMPGIRIYHAVVIRHLISCRKLLPSRRTIFFGRN
jgi:hypothetical protein